MRLDRTIPSAVAAPARSRRASRITLTGIENSLFDPLLGHMQSAQAIPIGGMSGEVALGLSLTRGPHLGKASAIRTCNSWAADRLRLAGVKTSLWPPFVQGLTWRYRKVGRV